MSSDLDVADPDVYRSVIQRLKGQAGAQHSAAQIAALEELYRGATARADAASKTNNYTSITPSPGFCLKTSDKKTGQKVFVNICGHDKVPWPFGWPNDKVPAHIQERWSKSEASKLPDSELCSLPAACGPVCKDQVHAEKPCHTIDFVVNLDLLQAAFENKGLKMYLAHQALECIRDKYDVRLDSRWKLFNSIQYVGDPVRSQRVRKAQKSLITEVQPRDEASQFALRLRSKGSAPAKKAAKPSGKPPQPALPPAAASTEMAIVMSHSGDPVTDIHTKISIPSSSSPQTWKTDQIKVEVEGLDLHITLPDCRPVHQKLTFHVDHTRASAKLEQRAPPESDRAGALGKQQYDLSLSFPVVMWTDLLPYEMALKEGTFEPVNTAYRELEP
ncbi:hypothetical protein WJX73_010798 [Symbiochloris irregularis]|uniref:PIH1 N-terminal domain-containing protein n=1 Tax=Symbiochloris irregularis TaxID=706552 RepID=A0AAW1NNA9_9CHLO